MKQFYLLAAILCLSISGVFAQGSLSGTVTDGHSPLPYATVNAPTANARISTSQDGTFILRLPEGAQKITFSMVGYRSLDTTIIIQKGKDSFIGAIKLNARSSLNEVMVKGMYSTGERKAIAMRRNSTAIMDVASADAIGKLPDISAAEAVQRVPGVSIDRDHGEGRYVTVRGAPSQWSSVTINGDRMPAAKTSGDLLGNRTVPLDLLPSDFLQYIQVVKAITPEYEGDAIGGTVNFITRTTPQKRTFRVFGALPYADRPKDKLGYNASLLYGDRLLNNKLGIMVNANVYERQMGIDNYVIAYGDDLHNVSNLDVRNYQNKRTNKGINAALDYQISPGTKIYANGYYTSLLDNERNRKTMHYFNLATNNAVLRWSVVDYYFKNYGGEAGVESKLSNNLTMNARVAYYNSWAGYHGPNTVDPSLKGYYYGNWVQTVKYDNLTNVNGTNYKFLQGDGPAGYEGDAPNNVQPHFLATAPYNPDNYYLDRYVISIRNITEIDKVGALDFKYKASDNLTIKYGGKYRYKTSSYDYRYVTWVYNSTSKTYLPTWEREPFQQSNWFPELGNAYDGLKFNYPTVNSFINPNGIPAVASHLTYTVQDATNSSYATGNYNDIERTGAGYGMAEWQVDKTLMAVGGLRYEYTNDKLNSYQYNDKTKTVTPVSDTKNSPAVLPMLNLAYKPTDEFDFRGSVTRTFSRPAFNDMSPSTRVNPNTLSITTGNPDLKPTFAWNYDFSGNYYFNSLSYLYGGLFYKDVKDAIYTKAYTENRTVDGVTGLYRISQPLNSDDAKLYGLELGYSQRFSFLPGAWNGLGVTLNYTHTKSKTTLADRPGQTIGIVNQSPNVFNATLFYEKYNFALRLAGNYREAFLLALGTNSSNDIYQDKDFHLDLNLSYTFPKNIVLFLDANNLTNQPLKQYEGVSTRPTNVEYYSSRGRLGVNWSF